MLQKDRKSRLGYEGDSEEVLGHPFFAELDMNKLISKEIEPPFKPVINSGQNLDFYNFESKHTRSGGVKESMIREEEKRKVLEQQSVFENFGFNASEI